MQRFCADNQTASLESRVLSLQLLNETKEEVKVFQYSKVN